MVKISIVIFIFYFFGTNENEFHCKERDQTQDPPATSGLGARNQNSIVILYKDFIFQKKMYSLQLKEILHNDLKIYNFFLVNGIRYNYTDKVITKI